MHHGTATDADMLDRERLKEAEEQRDEQWEQRQQREAWRREEQLRRKQKAGSKR